MLLYHLCFFVIKPSSMREFAQLYSPWTIDWLTIDARGASRLKLPNSKCSWLSPSSPELFFLFSFFKCAFICLWVTVLKSSVVLTFFIFSLSLTKGSSNAYWYPNDFAEVSIWKLTNFDCQVMGVVKRGPCTLWATSTVVYLYGMSTYIGIPLSSMVWARTMVWCRYLHVPRTDQNRPRFLGLFGLFSMCTYQTDQRKYHWTCMYHRPWLYISMNVVCAGTLGWMPWTYLTYTDLVSMPPSKYKYNWHSEFRKIKKKLSPKICQSCQLL